MKQLLLLMLVALSFPAIAQRYWNTVPSGTTNRLLSISFGAPSVGYISGVDSLLMKTTDGGRTWNRLSYAGLQFSIASKVIVHVNFVDANTGFAIVGNFEHPVYTGTTFKTSGGAASGSRYAWLVQIQDSLTKGRYLTAAALMGRSPGASNGTKSGNGVTLRDGPAGDSIIANYLDYFRLFRGWKGRTFSSSDSSELVALAQLCPHIDGAVIHQARMLLRVISNDYIPYNNSGCDQDTVRNMERRAMV